MAKALLGHIGTSTDLRLSAEVRRLQTRVRELESELVRVRAANVALAARVSLDDDILQFSVAEVEEPVFT